eukprot:269361_1
MGNTMPRSKKRRKRKKRKDKNISQDPAHDSHPIHNDNVLHDHSKPVETSVKSSKTKPGQKLVVNKSKYDDKTFSQMVVFGYTRRVESLLYMFVPNDVMSLVTSYYGYYAYIAAFDTAMHGEHLRFGPGHRVTKTSNNYCCSIVLFGNQVYSSICARYELSFLVSSLQHDFMVGYVPSSGNIKDWNNELGRDSNLYYSTGIYIYKHLNYFELCDKYNRNGKQSPFKLRRHANGCHALGLCRDMIKMSFNFVEDTLSIYVNQDLAISASLHRNKEIIPTFGLNDKLDQIRIAKIEFFDLEGNIMNHSVNNM